MNLNPIAQKRIAELERENARLKREREKPAFSWRAIVGQVAIQRLEPDYPLDLQF